MLCLGAGVYLLGSDLLSFSYPGAASAERPRFFISGALFFAALCLWLGLRTQNARLHVLGYSAMGVAGFTLWLILYGMEL